MSAHQKVMVRCNFLVGICLLAWLKYIDGGSGHTLLSRELPPEAMEVANKALPLADALSLLIDEYLTPLMAQEGVGLVVRNGMNELEVSCVRFNFH
jgi:hypothetical protein